MKQFDASKIYRNNWTIAVPDAPAISAGTIKSGEQWEKMVPYNFSDFDAVFDILDDDYEYISDGQVRVCVTELDTLITRWCNNNNVSRKEILPHIIEHLTKKTQNENKK